MPRTIVEILRWSYVNLAMAHVAVVEGAKVYHPRHYSVRSRLHAGLVDASMTIRPLADDERLKLQLPHACAYCGSPEALTADHVIAKHRGGPDTGDNLIWACRPCNTSKGAADLLVWFERRGSFPSLLLLRRYLKLAWDLCRAAGVLDREPTEAGELPIDIRRVPLKYPQPAALKLWSVPI